jgi:transcriptional regulator GlxA family with amidase domain
VTVSVAFLVYDGVDPRQLVEPFVWLAEASQNAESAGPRFNLFTVGRTKDVVTLSGGLRLLPDHIYPDAYIYDVIVVPGGPGAEAVSSLLRMMQWIGRASRQARLVCGVGSGLLLLGAAGLLAGQTVVAWPGLQERFPAIGTLAAEPIVRSGKLLTAAGHEQGAELGRLIAGRFYPG